MDNEYTKNLDYCDEFKASALIGLMNFAAIRHAEKRGLVDTAIRSWEKVLSEGEVYDMWESYAQEIAKAYPDDVPNDLIEALAVAENSRCCLALGRTVT